MSKFMWLLLLMATGIVLSGCTKMGTAPDNNTANAEQSDVSSYGLGGDDSHFSGQNLDDNYAATPAQRRQIAQLSKKMYFNRAKDALSDKGKADIDENAAFLLKNPDQFVMLAGYADPRGSQEYNFHLGQRRADAVRDELLRLGVASSQICTISYGELYPAVTPAELDGDWQKAYQMDRRTEINYGQRCEGAQRHG